jgi:hypothetical protein
MTDPLRPFAQACRSLWGARARGTPKGEDTARASSSGSTAAAAEARSRGSRAGETLRTRLTSRLASIDSQDTKQMRDAFVETVLIWELGDPLASDPGLADVVARVSEQLATDAGVVRRLEELLLQISGKRQPPR